MLTVEQRVQRGIAYLDLFGPENWRSLIDKQYINMSSRLDCPGGQVFGNYTDMPRFYGFSQDDYGFTMTYVEETEYSQAASDWYASDAEDDFFPVWGKALRDEWIKQLSV
jgi:hypothetical protein